MKAKHRTRTVRVLAEGTGRQINGPGALKLRAPGPLGGGQSETSRIVRETTPRQIGGRPSIHRDQRGETVP
jgi:hypothetical protein